MSTIDVLIVGAGPAGLTMACDLARRGLHIRIVDRLERPAIASKGKGLQPRTLEVFDDLGIVDRVLAHGRTYPPLRFYQGATPVSERTMMVIKEPSADVPYPNTLMLQQSTTEDLLRERLAELGGRVEYGRALKTLTQDADGVTATIEHAGADETVTARFLVAADGGRGVIRSMLGIAFEGETPSMDGMVVADVRVDGLDGDYWHFWNPGPQMLALCPLPHSDLLSLNARIAPDSNPELTLAALQTLVDERAAGAGLRLHDLRWISLFRPNIRMAQRFREGRVFLIGDAAHIHPPAGAQGLNTSVQDAYNLGWKLAAVLAGGDAALLDTYEEERMPNARAMLQRAEALYRSILNGEPAGMQRGDDEHQLLLNYRGSSACGPAQATPRLQPGDRMPDARLRTADGRETRLFDLMRGPHGVELFIGQPSRSAMAPAPNRYAIGVHSNDPTADAVDTGGSLRDLAGHVISVRPDGYIATIT